MSDRPTWSEAWLQIRAATKLLRETEAFARTATPSLVELLDDLITGAKGPQAPRMLRTAQAIRGDASGLIARARDLLEPLVLQLAPLIATERTDVDGVLLDLATYMRDNNEALATRGFTRGNVTADGTNVGDGTVLALAVDANGDASEAGGAYATQWRCAVDANTGASEGAALFDVATQGTPPLDQLDAREGLADRLRVRARTAVDGLLANASFRNHNSAATHPFAPWRVPAAAAGSYAGITQVTTGVRADRGTTTPSNPAGTSTALRLDGNDLALEQPVPRDLDPTRPHALVVWYRPGGSCDGTLTLRLGSSAVAVDLTGLPSTWTRLAIPTTLTGSAGADAWYAAFKQTPLTVSLALTSRTAGYVELDEVLLAPMDRFAGRWFTVIPGATPFEVGDAFTATDSLTNDTGIQSWLSRTFGRALPATTGAAITIADPS